MRTKTLTDKAFQGHIQKDIGRTGILILEDQQHQKHTEYFRRIWVDQEAREVIRFVRPIGKPDPKGSYQILSFADLPRYAKKEHYAAFHGANLSKAFVWSAILEFDPREVPKRLEQKGYSFICLNADPTDLTLDNYLVVSKEDAKDLQLLMLENKAKNVVREWRKAEKIADELGLPADIAGLPDRNIVLKYQQYRAGERVLEPGEISFKDLLSLQKRLG